MVRASRVCSFVLANLLLYLLAPSCRAESESAGRFYKEGRVAEAQDNWIGAYEKYKKAYELKPEEMKYRATYERVRVSAAAQYVKQGEQFVQEGNFALALAAFLKALDADPANELADQDTRKLERQLEAREHPGSEPAHLPVIPSAAAPVRLDISGSGPFTLHMVEDSRIVYQAIGKTAGINVLFDPEYSSRRIQVDLQDVTPLEALSIVGQISGTFWKPVTHNTIFVAQDTRTKRQQLSQQALQVFYLKNVSQASDFTDMQTALRNVFQATAKIYGLSGENAIVMRGTPDELQLAGMLVAGLDRPKPEVMVDITVMEVSRDKLREIGLSPPTSLTVNSGSSQTLNQVGRSSAYSISVGQAAVDFLLTDSDTRILQNPRLRAVDGQKADLKLGEKLPVATGSYTVPTSSTAAAAETQFQYLDVGVNIEMTPAIHSDRDVTLKLTVEVSAESGTENLEGVNEPVISQEKADQVIRLKDGEASILAGLVKKQITQSASGWPGLGEIPLMKYFFSTQSHEVATDELVFMIVPHVIRAPETDSNVERQIDTGTDTAVQLRDASIRK